jgi:ADP-ribose pyrophosphatase YjhB (NUDIX family)
MRWLSDEDFEHIYSKVPRLNIDLVIASSDSGFIMTKRAIEPYMGHWHLPGGTVYKGETAAEAALRIAKKETGLDTSFSKFLGFMEFPNEERGRITTHTVSLVLEVTVDGGEPFVDENASEIRYFKDMPNPVVPEHASFLKSWKSRS